MKKSFLSILLGSFLFYACGGNMDSTSYEKAEMQSTEAAYVSDESETAPDGNTTTKITNQKLIKTGNLSFEVNDISSTQKRLHDLAKKYNGYISNETSNNYGHRINNELILRFPNKHFENLIADISTGVEHFDQKNIRVQDVTEEFLDVSSRIENKKKLEERFSEILKKATTVAEILEIEKEINTLRTEIERLEGRLKYLKNQVSLSTLTISYYKTINETEHGLGNKFSRGFTNGWNNLMMFFVGLVNIWPFIIIIGLTVFFIRKMMIIRKNK